MFNLLEGKGDTEAQCLLYIYVIQFDYDNSWSQPRQKQCFSQRIVASPTKTYIYVKRRKRNLEKLNKHQKLPSGKHTIAAIEAMAQSKERGFTH